MLVTESAGAICSKLALFETPVMGYAGGPIVFVMFAESG